MKLQNASAREVKRVCVGSGICFAFMLAVFFLLSMVGVGDFGGRVVLSGALGTVIAVGNFTWLCLTIQNAAALQDEKKMKARFQRSYNTRLVLQSAWVVTAFLLPGFHVLAAAIPLLFPTVTLYCRQMKIAPQADK